MTKWKLWIVLEKEKQSSSFDVVNTGKVSLTFFTSLAEPADRQFYCSLYVHPFTRLNINKFFPPKSLSRSPEQRRKNSIKKSAKKWSSLHKRNRWRYLNEFWINKAVRMFIIYNSIFVFPTFTFTSCDIMCGNFSIYSEFFCRLFSFSRLDNVISSCSLALLLQRV